MRRPSPAERLDHLRMLADAGRLKPRQETAIEAAAERLQARLDREDTLGNSEGVGNSDTLCEKGPQIMRTLCERGASTVGAPKRTRRPLL